MSEASERLRRWATTGEGGDIDAVAMAVLDELERLTQFVENHRTQAELVYRGRQECVLVPYSFMKDPT